MTATSADADLKSSNSQPVPTGWIAEMTFVTENSMALHPAIQDRAEELLSDRVAGTGLTAAGLLISCAIYEDCPEEAANAADAIAVRLIEHLGLAPSSLRGPVLCRYRPIDEYFAPTAPVIPIGRAAIAPSRH